MRVNLRFFQQPNAYEKLKIKKEEHMLDRFKVNGNYA